MLSREKTDVFIFHCRINLFKLHVHANAYRSFLGYKNVAVLWRHPEVRNLENYLLHMLCPVHFYTRLGPQSFVLVYRLHVLT